MDYPIGARVAARMAELDISQAKLAEAVGMKQQGIQSIVAGKVERPRKLRELAKALHTTEEYLLGESDLPYRELQRVPVSQVTRAADAQAINRDTRVGIPPGEIPQVDASLGAGLREFSDDVQIGLTAGHSVVGAPVTGTWRIPPAVLQRRIRTGIGQLHFVECEGDSMEPRIRDGDVVLIDQSRRNPRMPGIFALWESDGLTIKRVEFVEGSSPPKLRLIPVNKAYKPYDKLVDEVQIIGRYVARFTVD